MKKVLVSVLCLSLILVVVGIVRFKPRLHGAIPKQEQNLLIFDLSGTLCDTRPFILKTLNSLGKKYGLEKVTDGALYKDMESRIMYKKIGIRWYNVVPIMLAMNKALERNVLKIKPFSDIKSIFKLINSRNWKIGIVTSSSMKFANSFIKKNNIENVRFILSGNLLVSKKYLLKYVSSHTQAKNIIYVGDETRDIKAAKANNMKTIAVTWGFHSKELLESYTPDYIVDSPTQVIDILQQTK